MSQISSVVKLCLIYRPRQQAVLFGRLNLRFCSTSSINSQNEVAERIQTSSTPHQEQNLPTSHRTLPDRQICETLHLVFQSPPSRHGRIIYRLGDTEFRKDSKVRSTRIKQKLTEKKRTSEPLIRREEARGKEEPISRRPTSKKQLPFRPPAASKAAAMVSGGMREERGEGLGILRGLKVVESAGRGTGMVLAFWETDLGLRHVCFYGHV